MRTKTCFLLKMMYIRLVVRVQRRQFFLFIHPVCLSVYARSRSRKYSSNVFKLMYGIQVYYSMFYIENGVHKINGSCRKTYKRIKGHYSQ